MKKSSNWYRLGYKRFLLCYLMACAYICGCGGASTNTQEEKVTPAKAVYYMKGEYWDGAYNY